MLTSKGAQTMSSFERCAMKGNSHRQLTQLFQLLAHPGRLHILDELRRGDCCVCHLQAILRRPQPYISQQLRVLREAGVIECHKKGLFVHYSLASPQIERLLAEVLGPAGTAVAVPGCMCPRCVRRKT